MRLHRLFVHAILLVVLLASPQAATGDAATGPFILMDLGTLGGNRGVARAVNNSGQVVGTSSTAGGKNRAFSWTAAGGMIDLGTLGGPSSETAGAEADHPPSPRPDRRTPRLTSSN